MEAPNDIAASAAENERRLVGVGVGVDPVSLTP
jgi:hypothetical protein